MKLGEKIKLLRTEKELTQPELARKAGIEQSYLSKLENDKAVPSFDIINRISMALETTGMDLIDTLSHSYVEENLSHIPEVAAEYASIKYKREASMKKRFIAAAFTIVLGIGIYYIGYKNLIFIESAYKYQSNGVVKEGENILQFQKRQISEINESLEEKKQRLIENRGRFDKEYYISNDFLGNDIIKNVEGGRRHYKYAGHNTYKMISNDFISIFGIMLMASGLFAFLFNIRFKPQ